MRRFLLLTIAASLVACASDGNEKSNAMLKNDAIDDFIKVSELEPEKSIRLNGTMRHEVITDDYVFVTDRRKIWLVSFQHRCFDIDGPEVTPDVRRERGVLRAGVDTIRGCRIRDIYELNEGMREEVEVMTRPYE